jgi:hypothetical protein
MLTTLFCADFLLVCELGWLWCLDQLDNDFDEPPALDGSYEEAGYC